MAGIMDALRGDIRGAPRLVYTYTIPESIPNPFKTIGLVELKASEQILMSRMLSSDASPEEQMSALVKACIYEIDGARAKKEMAEFEIMWEQVHPKVRSLLRRVVSQLHVPEQKEDEDFFKSRTVRTEG
jgi:hypothetical protein